LTPSAASADPRPRAITTPFVDALCVGGLSLAVLLPLMLTGTLSAALEPISLLGLGRRPDGSSSVSVTQVLLLTSLLNLPHFMASYRVVYGSRETRRRHFWAVLGVPALLIAYGVVALAMCRSTGVYVEAMVAVASAYLAWHYTGQAWGMMATFSVLGGTPFDARERLLMRSALRILLVFHVTWFAHLAKGLPRGIESLVQASYTTMGCAAVGSLALAVTSLVQLARRHGRRPPWRVLIPFAAIYVWYAAMAMQPGAIFLVQLGHALQYLIFPTRVELNRARAAGSRPGVGYVAAYFGVLVLAGFVASDLFPYAVRGAVAVAFGPLAAMKLSSVVLSFINIHHYFTDGVSWKISNPDVRRELFAHL
jgi:hypothetical protein